MKPVVKWPGGKRQLLPELISRLPLKISHYCEPFFGGGALFFALRAGGYKGPATLGDLNPDVVALHRALRDSVNSLIGAFEDMVDAYQHLTAEKQKEFYYRERDAHGSAASDVDRGVRLLFLNGAGFNGLYRVNRSSGYNVPFGDGRVPGQWLDKTKADSLREASKALQGAEIIWRTFDHFPVPERTASFFYLDPPYAPHDGKKDAFTAYIPGGFSEVDQARLAAWARRLVEDGHDVMASNHDCSLIRRLWHDFTIETVSARRAVNSDPNGRGAVGEVIMRRYWMRCAKREG